MKKWFLTWIPGSVSHQFDICGLIRVKKENCEENEIFELSTNNGANDFKVEADFYEIFSEKSDLHSLQIKLEKKYELSFSGVIYNPKNTIKVDKEGFEKIINFIETLEDDDDVQKVYSNFEVDQKYFRGVIILIVFGIDPGVSGALSIYEHKKLKEVIDMPTMSEGKK